MNRRVWLFGFILAVPIIGFGAAAGLRGRFNSELRSTFQYRYADAPPSVLSQVSMDRLCETRSPMADSI